MSRDGSGTNSDPSLSPVALGKWIFGRSIAQVQASNITYNHLSTNPTRR